MFHKIYSPNFPKLMAAEGPKCGKWGRVTGGRVPTRCVKAQGHDGNHLQDVDPTFVRDEFLPSKAPAPAPRMPLDANAQPLVPGTTYKVRIRTSDEHPSVTRLLVFRYVHVEDDGSRTFVWLDVEGPVGYSEAHHVSVEPLNLEGWTPGELQEAYGK